MCAFSMPRAVLKAHKALAYPIALAAAVLVLCAAGWFLSDGPGRAGLLTIALTVTVCTGLRMGYAVRQYDWRADDVRSVRQEQRLFARRWIELRHNGVSRWVPVYFDPALAAIASPAPSLGAIRPFPAGRARHAEPPGRLIDNPASPTPARADAAGRLPRRLLLDAQPAATAPLVGVLWVYAAGGGAAAFTGASIVAAAAIMWLWAIRGSDPS